MHRFNPSALVVAASSFLCAAAHAQFSVLGSFTATTSPVEIALGVDHVTGHVYIYSAFAGLIQRYSPSGTLLGSIPSPGEGANDGDIEFTSAPLVLNGTPLPAATMLFINGETAVAEVYALDKDTGAVLATLVTQFGVSHVVGGAHHPGRGTLFLVQDRVPGGANANLVAEINPANGAVIGSFRITDTRPTFTVNYGDIEVGGNGNLFIASEDELTIAEFTPSGAFVTEHAMPTAVNILSGIGIDRSTCDLWAVETGGTIWRLRPVSQTHPMCDRCIADVDGGFGDGMPDGGVTIEDLLYYLNIFDLGLPAADVDDGSAMGTPDGGVTIEDLLYFLARFDAGC